MVTRPLRDVFTELTGEPGAGADLAPSEVLAAHGHPDLPDGLVAEAIVSYADTAPYEVAEHLAPYVMANGPVPSDIPEVDPAGWLAVLTSAPAGPDIHAGPDIDAGPAEPSLDHDPDLDHPGIDAELAAHPVAGPGEGPARGEPATEPADHDLSFGDGVAPPMVAAGDAGADLPTPPGLAEPDFADGPPGPPVTTDDRGTGSDGEPDEPAVEGDTPPDEAWF